MKRQESLSGKGLTRRQFLKSSATAAATAAMINLGFNPGLARVLAQDESVTLAVLAYDWGSEYNALMDRIGTLFTEANPNIIVAWEHVQDAHTTLLTRVAGNIPPDAAMSYVRQANTLAQLGTFINLDEYLAVDNLTREDFVKPLYDQGVADGSVYAIPGGADYIAMIYSKDIYRDIGLDPEKTPTTTDEFMEINRAILRKETDGTVTRVGYLPIGEQMQWWGYIFGGEWYDAATQKITANDPAIVAAFEWVLDYVKEIGFDQFAALQQRPATGDAGNLFSSGELGHYINGFWTYATLDAFSPEVDYGVYHLPTLTGVESERERYMVGGWLFGIPVGAANPEAAWKFLKYAFIDEAALMGVETLNGPGYLPQLPAWETGIRELLGDDNRMSPYIGIFSEVGAAATKAFPTIPVAAFYTDQIQRAFDAVMLGEQTPQDALDEVTRNVQSELDAVS
ncbi:MAG: extracellular solute-binding protein [Anaerolineae bacterium]|nr:extracellular solute-binding protein [Anaerolineae bacterium]